MLDCTQGLKLKATDWPRYVDGEPITLEQSGALIQLLLYSWGNQQSPTFDEACRVLGLQKRKAVKLRIDHILEIAADLRKQRVKIEPIQRTLVARRFDWRCRYCGTSIEQALEIDHAIPVSRRGLNRDDNYRASCPECNRAKGTMTEDEFVAFRAGGVT